MNREYEYIEDLPIIHIWKFMMECINEMRIVNNNILPHNYQDSGKVLGRSEKKKKKNIAA